MTGFELEDISGMIGQYAHGNEPSHHLAYLFDFAGQPYKTQFYAHQIMSGFYKNEPDGLIGNEDCGQMSAWYVMSAMGIYPVCPGKPIYEIGTPIFDKIKIRLENGKSFIITANNVSDENFYIQSAEFNGKKYEKYYIQHSEIMKGGNLNFKMDKSANKNWG